MALSANPKDLINLRKQLAFYGAYHTDHTNVGIHIVGVPTIVFSLQVLLARLGPLDTPPVLHLAAEALPPWVTQYAVWNWSAVFALAYWTYYNLLDTVGAVLLAPIWYGLYYGANYVNQTSDSAIPLAIALHAVGWISQFVGHFKFEGRAPALLDNLLGAVVLAPFFVWLEVIFQLGYRPELQRELKNDVGKLVTDFRKKEGDKKRAKKAQ